MKKVLFTATVDSHILHFHIPYLKLFKDNGYEVHVATNGNEEIPYCDVKHVVSFERSPFKINNLKAIKQLKKIIDEEKFDIIHCHTPMGSVVTRIAAMKARKNGTRVIYTAHGFHFFREAPKKNWLIYYPIEKLLSRVTDDLILINSEDYNLAKKKFHAIRTHLVAGVGVAPNKFSFDFSEEEKQELRKSIGLKETDVVMIYPAELSKRKNQGMLIEVMKKLIKENESFKLLLPGLDSFNGKYQEMVKEYKLENNIKFLGYRQDIPKLFKISDVSVSSAVQEGLPVNLLEAMQVGMPIVATNCRGNRDLIEEGKNGYIVKINDIDAMTDRILKIYKEKDKRHYVDANKRIIKKYDLKSVLNKIEDIYKIKKEQIRVLHVLRVMEMGGAQALIMNLYRNIDREKVQFDFLVSDKDYFDEEILKLGGRIFYIPYLTKKGQLNYEHNIIKFLKEHNEYKIVHSHIDQVTGIIMQAARKANVPVRIAHSHNTKNTNGFIGKIYKNYLQNKINKNATNLFGCSEEACKWLFKERANEAKILNNGIDIEKFKYSIEKREKVRKELNISEGTMVVGHIGAFRKQKNHEGLINIYNEYLKTNSNSRLLLCGDGDLKTAIEKKVTNLGIENNVKFLGIRNDTDALYSAFDIFLFPSLYEGLSVALIEAQTSGVKILASDTIDKKTKLTDNIEFISLENKNWNKYFVPNENRCYNKNIDIYDIRKIANRYQEYMEELNAK